VKQPTRYPQLFDSVLALTDEGDMLPPDREVIRQRLLAQLQPVIDRAHARAYSTGESVGIGALNGLRALLANPLDDAGLYLAGMLAQRVIYAAPMFDRLRKEKKTAQDSVKAAQASKQKRAKKADKVRDKVVTLARKMLDAGKERRALASLIEQRMKGAPSAATIRRYLSDAGI
jgi:hypothetical protein